MKTLKKFQLITLLTLIAVIAIYAQETKENPEFKLAVNLYNDNMLDLALDQFKNFINTYPSSSQAVEARFYVALIQFKLKQFEDARASFQNYALSYADNSKAPEAWFKIGECYFALKNYHEAALAFERVKVFHPNSQLAPEALIKSAECFKKDGDFANAKRNLQVIIKDYSGLQLMLAARLSLAEIYLEEDNIELARSETQRVIEGESKYKPDAIVLMSRICMALGQSEEAEKNLLLIFKNYKSSPIIPEAYFELGVLYKNSGDFSKAISQFEKVLIEKETDIVLKEKTVFELGMVYYESSDFKNAAKYFKNFVQSFPESERLYEAILWAGKSSSGGRNYKTALTWYDRIISSKMNDKIKAKALVYASFSAEESGNIILAIEYCRKFLQQYPNLNGNAEAAVRIADLSKNQMKDYQEAIKYYEQAIQILGSYPSETFQRKNISGLMLKIADCYRANGLNEFAIKKYEEIVNNFPSDLEGLTAKRMLESINIFSGKDYKTGTEKIAKLIGDLLTDMPKGEIAFNLAEVYYKDIKEFLSAIEYYSLAINNGIKDEKLVQAAYNRANAAINLSANDTIFTKRAIDYCIYFINNYPADDKIDEVRYKLLVLEFKSLPAEKSEKLLTDYVANNPKSFYIPSVLNMLGDYYFNSQKYNDAVSVYKRVTVGYPKSEFAENSFFLLGNTYFESGKNDSAILSLSELIEKYPNSMYTASSMKSLAIAFMNQGQSNEAINVIQSLVDRFFYTDILNGVESLYSKALIISGNYDKAINFIKTLIDIDENNPFFEKVDPELKLLLAQAYGKSGEYQKSIPLYHGYLKNAVTKERFSEVYIALGNIAKAQGVAEVAGNFYKLAGNYGDTNSTKDIANLLYQNGRYQDAEKYYLVLLQKATNEEDRKYFESRIIVSKLRRDDLKEAEKMISGFEKRYKKNPVFFAEFEYEKGLYHFRNQELSLAKKIFEIVIDDYGKTEFAPLSEYYLGKILEIDKKIPDAIKKYDSVLKSYPNSDAVPRTLLALGNLNYNAEKFEDAIRYYQRIVDSPEKAGDILIYAMTNLIEAYESTKLYDAALKLTRSFLERYPKDSSKVDKQIKIGILYTRLEYYDQAILQFQNLLDHVGNEYEAEIRYNLGETYYYKGDYQQSILEFLKVPYLVNSKGVENWIATSFYMAGQAYERMGKYDKAISMYQQIIDKPGIDVTFKAGAQKEIDRVQSIIK
jgi:TolA-binding protein